MMLETKQGQQRDKVGEKEKDVKGIQLVEKMCARKVGGEGRVWRGEKEEEKGGHIVESRPGFLFLQSADKSLAQHAYPFPPPFLSHCFINMPLHDIAPP